MKNMKNFLTILILFTVLTGIHLKTLITHAESICTGQSCRDDNWGGLQAQSAVQQEMTSTWDNASGTLRIFRGGQLVVVYQRDTKPGRSIANAITELYAVGHPSDNLVSDSSPIVPPQILVGVNDEFINDTCSNDPLNNSCDYFVHHNPRVKILQPRGEAVIFRVEARATQHNNQGTPLDYSSIMTVMVPFHQTHTIVIYNVQTSLKQPVNVRHALRPLPFYELVNNAYNSISYLDTTCQAVDTVPIPTEGPPDNLVFLHQSPVCNNRPWSAIYHNAKGNLGVMLKSWNWSSGHPELLSYTETQAHPRKPNLYFQSDDHSRMYQSGTWHGQIIFLAYTNANDYTPVQKFRDMFTARSFFSRGAYDGWVLESAETSNKGGTMNVAQETFQLGDNAADQQYRAILSFNTSALPDNATITKVTLKIKKKSEVGTNPFTTHNGLRVDIGKPYFGTSAGLQVTDFQAAPGRSQVGTFGRTPANGWYSVNLSATAFQWVNRSGATQFRLRFGLDDNNDSGADFIKFYSGNAAVASRPRLIVEYSVP